MLYYTIASGYRAVKRYLERHRLEKEDFTSVWSKQPHRFKADHGWKGYTYLGWDKQGINEDIPENSLDYLVTDVHESIHTDDEKETRYIVDWMIEPIIKFMEKQYNKYKKVAENLIKNEKITLSYNR